MECKLYHLPVADMCTVVEPESVDVIITDPPYEKDYLPVYDELADFAAHALKPGGDLVVMAGHIYLDEVMRRLQRDELKWWWLIAYHITGERADMVGRGVNVAFKPILWYGKRPQKQKLKTNIGDDLISVTGRREAKLHKWGQNLAGFQEIVRRFTTKRPNALICDPFLGGGTTAIAAISQGHSFIGSDIELDCIQTTRERIHETIPPPLH